MNAASECPGNYCVELKLRKAQEWGWRLITEEHHATVWSDGSVLYFDSGGDYMTLYVCQNAQNCTPKEGDFAKCQ